MPRKQYVNHMYLFNVTFRIPVWANKKEDAEELLNKARFMVNNIGYFLGKASSVWYDKIFLSQEAYEKSKEFVEFPMTTVKEVSGQNYTHMYAKQDMRQLKKEIEETLEKKEENK